MAWADYWRGRRGPPGSSADGVPALGKREQWPRAPVVVGSTRRRVRALGLDHEIILRGWCDGCLHGFQHQIVFGFAHRALRGSRGDGRKSTLLPDCADRSSFNDSATTAKLVTKVLSSPRKH